MKNFEKNNRLSKTLCKLTVVLGAYDESSFEVMPIIRVLTITIAKLNLILNAVTKTIR